MQKELSEMSLEELWELFPIILTEHNRLWSEWYKEELELLSRILKDSNIVRISHIGSTAIKGIWAKPTIDLLVETKTIDDFDLIKKLLVKQGYLYMSDSEARMVFNKGYTKYGFDEKVYHIHIRVSGDNDELYFRDYMNEHSELAKEYENLKLSLWKQYEHDRDAYTDAKTQFVKEYTTKAKSVYGDRYS